MAFNFSLSFGYLTQTDIYNHNATNSNVAGPVATLINGNITVKVYPRWYKYVTVEWSVPVDWGRCLFNVYFCPSDAGPFERLNSSPIDDKSWRDVETQEYSKFNKGFYIVEAILLDQNNATIKSNQSSWETGQTRWVQLRSTEIQRREYLLLSKFTGKKSFIFSKKTYGERCPECWNSLTEKAIKDNCKTCYGTTFKGGYFTPTVSYMQYEPTPNQNMKTYFGVFEPNQVGAWTISFPEIRPDDIIIRQGDWSLYRVDALGNTELQGMPVRQIAKLSQLSKSNIEYELINQIDDFPAGYR